MARQPQHAPAPVADSKTKYLIRFYEAKLFQGDKDIRFSKLLLALIKRGTPLPIRALIENSSDYQVRNLTSHDGGKEIRGSFVRFRQDVPMSGARTSLVEKPVTLDDGHEILEKNYFSLFIGDTYEVIAFHQTLVGGTISGLARYFSAIAGEGRFVFFNDLLTAESLDELLKGTLIKHIDFRIAKPRAARFAPDPDDTWTQQGMEFMNQTGATSFQAKLSTKSPTRGLFSNIKDPLKKLLASPQTRKLKIKLSDHSDPIDLFADRIKARIDIDLKKGQPNPDQVYNAIWSAKIKLEPSFLSYFGKKYEALE